MKRLYLLTCLVLFLTPGAFAQYIDSFPQNHEEYGKVMEKFMKATKRDDCKELSEQFLLKWMSFDATQRDQIIDISNIMVERKMRAFPYFYDFYNMLLVFANSEQPAEAFENWHESMKSVLVNSKQGRHKPYQTYIEFSTALFGKNALYDSQAKTWAVTYTSYKLLYDTVPKIYVPYANLYAYTKGDTITIYNTRGYFSPLDNMWYGDFGTVFWDRAGLDTTKVFAKFGKYTMDLSKSLYRVDSVKFTNKEFLSKELEGMLTDKLVVNNEEERSTYPRFDSYDQNIEVNDIAERVKFRGGVSMYGAKVIGRGSREQKAVFEFYTANDKLAVLARSKQFSIKRLQEVKSTDAEVTVYLEEDSIFHPGLELQFKIENRQLTLNRGQSGVAATAFFNSFHQLETNAEEVIWELDKPEMTFDMVIGKGKTPAIFESANYFERNRLEKYQNIMDYNPISVIKKYAEDHGTNEIYADEIAKKMGANYSIETIRRLLYNLVEEGFIYYDQDIETIYVKDKTFHYVFANRDIIDYDIIKIQALTPKTTGTLNLANFSLDLEGVQSVKLSDSQFVVIFPKDRFLKVLKNRDMEFGGTVFAGRMDYEGDGFSFHYDEFELGLTNVDKFLINIPGKELDNYGKPKLIPLRTVIEGLTGGIAIDEPNNKSGKESYPDYPIFRSLQPSYAYYDKKNILGGVYPRKRFYFELNPFEIDSLNSFNPSGIIFPGTLTSAEIFEPFTEQLRIQEDRSLGFKHLTPGGGRALYQGKGSFQDSVFLSNAGLRGKGTIKYISSTSVSQDVIFYPDSLNCTTDTFFIEKGQVSGVEFPDVQNSKVRIHWVPYGDSMQIFKIKSPFRMFGTQADMVGDLTLTPWGLKGVGVMEFEGAQLIGLDDEFRFKSNSVEIDRAELKFAAADPEKLAFRAPDVSANVNFKNRKGHFKSNLEDMSIEFPYNQYKTSIDEFTWDMDEKTLDFKSEKELALFISTHPEQDSLQFNGEHAVFSLEKNVLDIQGVPFIKVADAKITPVDGEVIVDPGARMRELKNATVECDTLHYYHKLYESNVKVYGRKYFMGSGMYDYVSKIPETQQIKFGEISTEQNEENPSIVITKGKGAIPEEQGFFLNPRIAFKGDALMTANRKYLTFEGFAKLEQNYPGITTQWFSFKNEINPDSMLINVVEPKNESGSPLFAGFLMASDPIELYTAFMDVKRGNSDHVVFNSDGVLVYDAAQNEFIIGNEARVTGRSDYGNILRFNDETGIFKGEGQMDMVEVDLVEIKSVGSMTHDLNENKYTCELVVGFNFEFNQELLKMMYESFRELAYDMPDINYATPLFENSIQYFVEDEKKLAKFMEEYKKTGIFKKTDDIKTTLLFTDIHMMWDPTARSFVTIQPIGLSYIGSDGLNRKIVGYMEFGRGRSGHFYNIYMQAAEEEWYFFQYKNKIMNILTPNKEFNKILTGLALEKRRSKGPNGQIFVFQKGGSNLQRDDFVQRMKAYLGQE